MKKTLLIFALYFLVVSIYTYPLILKMGNSTYGYSGDNLGAMHYLWWWKYTFINHLDIRNSFFEQSPFGFRADSETGSVFYFWPLKFLTLISNEVTAYNLVLLLSFPLAALAMYLLVKFFLSRLIYGGEKENGRTIFLISLWAGFAFSFSPYHFWKAYNHLDLALIWSLPLAFLFLFQLLDEAKNSSFRLRTIFLSSFFSSATILTNFYYGFFLLISYAIIYPIFYIIYRPKFKALFVSAVLTIVFTLIAVIPFMTPTVIDAYINKGTGQSAARVANYDRPLLDVVSLSARPWDYLIPSQDNPILGFLSAPLYKWVSQHGKDFKVISGPIHERTIFLGFTSVFITLLGLVLLFKRKDFREKHGKSLFTLLLIIFSLFLISMPPYIFVKGKFTIYLPSYFLYLAAPMFRTYSRLGIFILMFIILSASLVLKYLFRSSSKVKITIYFFLLLTFSLLEFANVPPSKVIDLKEPKSFEYVGQQPGDFSFIVYPKEFNVAELLGFQSQFKKGFLNFHSQSEYYKLWSYLEDYRNPRTYSILSSLGVKYVVFQKKLIFDKSNPVDDLWYTRALKNPLGQLPGGVILEKDFDDSSVYRVTANPVGFVVFGKNPTRIFPKNPLTISEPSLRVYLANVRDTLGVKFKIKLKDINGMGLTYSQISGENVIVTKNPNGTGINFENERGFIDIFLNEKNLIIGSISIEEIK